MILKVNRSEFLHKDQNSGNYTPYFVKKWNILQNRSKPNFSKTGIIRRLGLNDFQPFVTSKANSRRISGQTGIAFD